MWEAAQSAYEQFVRYGHKPLYKLAFSTPQFPYWFVAQAVYACYAVKRSFARRPRSLSVLFKKLFISFAMTFTSRELYAYLFDKLSPINRNPQTLGVFFVVFILMNMSPWDLVYKLTGAMFMMVSLAQGFNQVRYLTLLLRHLSRFPEFYGAAGLPVAIGFTVLDNVVEIVLRVMLNGEETAVTSMGRLIFGTMLMALFWAGTNQNYFTRYLGIHPKQMSALTLGFALALSNGAGVMATVAY